MTLLATAATVQAQAAGAPADTTRSRECWRGHPAPECTMFWITEFGVDVIASSTQTVVSENFGGGNVYRYTQKDFETRFVWTVGPMFNTSPRTAIGGTVSISPLG